MNSLIYSISVNRVSPVIDAWRSFSPCSLCLCGESLLVFWLPPVAGLGSFKNIYNASCPGREGQMLLLRPPIGCRALEVRFIRSGRMFRSRPYLAEAAQIFTFSSLGMAIRFNLGSRISSR